MRFPESSLNAIYSYPPAYPHKYTHTIDSIAMRVHYANVWLTRSESVKTRADSLTVFGNVHVQHNKFKRIVLLFYAWIEATRPDEATRR